jgi:hypothetical protein
MNYDPGSANANITSGLGLSATAGKFCADDSFKAALDANFLMYNSKTLAIPGFNVSITAYCLSTVFPTPPATCAKDADCTSITGYTKGCCMKYDLGPANSTILAAFYTNTSSGKMCADDKFKAGLDY